MHQGLSPVPEFPDDMVDECRQKHDAMPLAFEWYKYTAVLAVELASMSPDTSGFRFRSAVHQAVLRGLLNRCARLMLSTVQLACERGATETMAILLRCIVESAIRVTWLTDNARGEHRLTRFMSDSLRSDHELEKLINRNIQKRGGDPLVIENRMLESIDRCRDASGCDVSVIGTERMPSFQQVLREAGYPEALYVTVQRIGSQSVHGMWADLLTFYLEQKDGRFELQDAPGPPPQINYFILPARLLLDALVRFSAYMVADGSVVSEVREHMQRVSDGLAQCIEIEGRPDFDIYDPSGGS